MKQRSIATKVIFFITEEFLKSPKEDANYRKLREFLNDYREKQGALYVYTIQLEQEAAVLMIDGQPLDSDMASQKNRWLLWMKLITLPIHSLSWQPI